MYSQVTWHSINSMNPPIRHSKRKPFDLFTFIVHKKRLKYLQKSRVFYPRNEFDVTLDSLRLCVCVSRRWTDFYCVYRLLTSDDTTNLASPNKLRLNMNLRLIVIALHLRCVSFRWLSQTDDWCCRLLVLNDARKKKTRKKILNFRLFLLANTLTLTHTYNSCA